jgi:hypothetical protein
MCLNVPFFRLYISAGGVVVLDRQYRLYLIFTNVLDKYFTLLVTMLPALYNEKGSHL